MVSSARFTIILAYMGLQMFAGGFQVGFCITKEEQKVLDWKPPTGMQKMLPYQLAGFDRDGSPVWAVPFGKWDIRAFLEKGDPGKAAENFDKYMDQLMLRFSLSPKIYETPLDEWTVVGNLEGYSILQLAHIPTVQRSLEAARKYSTYAGEYNNFKKAYSVNTNFLFVSLLRILRPIFGTVFEKVEVLGTNQGNWSPVLFKEIAKDQLPKWLGGSEDHKPVVEYS